MELGTYIALIAVLVALWQLKLQRDEIAKSSRVNALIAIAGLLQDRIRHYERIIDDHKRVGKKWKGYADIVNGRLRPLLLGVDRALVDNVSADTAGLDMLAIRDALRVSVESNDED
jgi:hypothetical protein